MGGSGDGDLGLGGERGASLAGSTELHGGRATGETDAHGIG